jgi:hypothetical protein
MHRRFEPSPQALSRVGGVLYLIIIVIGLFGEAFVRDRIVVPSDAAATAASIRSMESLWRFGIAGELLLSICGIEVGSAGKRAAGSKLGSRGLDSRSEKHPPDPTATGRVVSGESYQVEIDPDFKPFRVRVDFLEAKDASIKR